ncbi:hypothetical protein [Mobiluncus mulieris]|nr:hypothetical protein [Mobiluncus mulieris]
MSLSSGVCAGLDFRVLPRLEMAPHEAENRRTVATNSDQPPWRVG